MKAYLALIKIDIKLAGRDKSVLFFNYLFPLIFFFAFSEMMGKSRGGVSSIVTMVLTIGILGNGLWGSGMRAVQEREMNILRRFKVTPISPAPLLVASMVTGWLVYLPAVVFICALAHFLYGMPLPARWLSLLVLITLGVFAFRAIGLIVASIVNGTQESTIIIQVLYMPMLFLSGSTIPATLLPSWAQVAGQFIPASYLVAGFQGIFLRGETLAMNWSSALALVVTMVLATFVSVQIFRWEKDEKVKPKAKLWVLAVLSPFLILGGYQAYSKEQMNKNKVLWRDLLRMDTFLVRGARIFVGNGKVIESGAVLVKDGKISEVFDGSWPEAKTLNAEAIEAAGKTLLPGLIDVRVHLAQPDGPDTMDRALAAYLYCGVTAVQSDGDAMDRLLDLRGRIASGRRLGAELFVQGNTFAAIASSQQIPDDVLARMARQGDPLVPGLSALSAASGTHAERLEMLNRSLVQQVGPKGVLDGLRKMPAAAPAVPRASYEQARRNLRRAYLAGVTLVTGSDAGRPFVIHGPTVQQELALWVDAGIPPAVALQAATGNAARLLRAARIGSVEKGHDADLLLVDGNPLADISATERISLVVYKGERVRRSALFDQK